MKWKSQPSLHVDLRIRDKLLKKGRKKGKKKTETENKNPTNTKQHESIKLNARTRLFSHVLIKIKT